MTKLLNERTGRIVVADLDVRSDFFGRASGYAFRPHPAEGKGLLLLGVGRVHTCFLRFPVSIYHLDASLRIISALDETPPFRFPPSPHGCVHTLEIPHPSGIGGGEIASGDRMVILIGVRP